MQTQHAYRRILAPHWSLRNGIYVVEAAAYIPKPGESLSVFLATKVASRRYVLQDHINKTLERLEDPDVPEKTKEKIRRRQNEGRLTVERLYQDGWRIAEYALELVPSAVFDFDPPDGDPDGHVNIIGLDEDFERFASVWARESSILSEAASLWG